MPQIHAIPCLNPDVLALLEGRRGRRRRDVFDLLRRYFPDCIPCCLLPPILTAFHAIPVPRILMYGSH